VCARMCVYTCVYVCMRVCICVCAIVSVCVILAHYHLHGCLYPHNRPAPTTLLHTHTHTHTRTHTHSHTHTHTHTHTGFMMCTASSGMGYRDLLHQLLCALLPQVWDTEICFVNYYMHCFLRYGIQRSASSTATWLPTKTKRGQGIRSTGLCMLHVCMCVCLHQSGLL